VHSGAMRTEVDASVKHVNAALSHVENIDLIEQMYAERA
jgi:hypothetical protein